MKVRQAIRIGVMLTILLLSIQTVFAQVRPAMNVYVNWTPDEQLTSIDINGNGTAEAGDDFRYVDMQIYAAGNVAFWAVELSCNVGNDATFELISLNFPDEWGNLATNDSVDNDDFYYTPQTTNEIYSLGVLGFTVTRIGVTNAPLGVSGQNFTQLIATARFRVKPLVSNTTVAASCRVMDFLDRDGNVSIRGRQTRLGDLRVLVGYTLTGTALREGTSLHQNIRVTCYSYASAQTRIAYTDARGNFKFGGATNTTDVNNWLRDYGVYRCLFTSEFALGVDDVQILQSAVFFDLQSPEHYLLPVVLRAGDHQDNDVMNFDDIVSLTTVYGNIVSPFATGDANGSGLVDDTDLVITAGNINTETQLFSGADNGADATGYLSNHVIYGMGRDLDPKVEFPNGKIWLGDALSGAVTPMNARSRSRDFWPQLSPDGKRIAYVSENSRSGLHELSILDTGNGRATTFRMARDWTLHAFAPSWSPDGSRVAFVCAADTPDNQINVGYLYNRGDICIINAADTRASAIIQLNVSSKIYPPTWMTYDLDLLTPELEAGYVLLYGGTDGKIHYYDVAHASHGIVPVSAGSTDVLSQPNVVHYLFDDTSYLAYKLDVDEGTEVFNPYLNIGTLAYDGSSFGGSLYDHDTNAATPDVADVSTGVTTAVNGTDHVTLSSLTLGLDYYDISPTLDIQFYYEYNYAGVNFSSTDPFTMYTLMHDNTSPLNWISAKAHIPDSLIGHPVGVANGVGIYSPLSGNATYLHAHRVTFDWVP